MRNLIIRGLVSSALLLFCTNLTAAAPLVEHALEVNIDPDAATLTVTDVLTLPDERAEWPLFLHADLDPRVKSGNAEIVPAGRIEHLARYRLIIQQPGPVTLTYGGRILHAREQIAEGMGRTREWSRGAIGADGVFLDGNSGWYPRIDETLQAFDLKVTLPAGWTAVSQGMGPGDPESGISSWTETHPQDDIYLIAAPFARYQRSGSGFEAQVYLRQPDEALARPYLDATETYVALYANLIGPYPFAKFALVENSWETGYGMPSFTLLGPQVIRLPFILHTSYPHEILHNWWGNSVYIDYSAGNWGEGLTTYLADHLLKERAGEGWAYRREMLKGYADYVRDSSDFPLTEFRGRHGAASQAIGYGKSAMLFHMLRRKLGDATFKAGLQRFYADHRFTVAGFDDLRRSFEAASDRDLGEFFETWTTRTGAPRLRLTDVAVVPDSAQNGFVLSARIEQTQPGAPFPLRVPVSIQQENGDPVDLVVELTGSGGESDGAFRVTLASQPIRLAVDPWFDVFRELLPGETPVALSNLFGAERGLILLPAAAPAPFKRGYQGLAEAWQSGHPGWEVRWDDSLEDLPKDKAIWLLGWENRWLEPFSALTRGVTLDPKQGRVQIAGDTTDPGSTDLSAVLTAWRGEQPIGWLGAGNPEALPGLARKLPHYGKYSYLLFTGTAPDNQAKGQWTSGDSELIHRIGPERELPPIAEPPALVQAPR